MRRALCTFALVCVHAASAVAQPAPASSACGALAFTTEVLSNDKHTNLCPKPIDPTLEQLQGTLERTAAKNTAVFFEVLATLRDYCHSETSTWRTALAEHIDTVLATAKGLRRPPADFAAVRNTDSAIDPESCLFMTGDTGSADYACYVIAGTPSPAKASLVTHVLTDFADAYLAHRALGIAYAAMVKLDVPALQQALTRLNEANQRWDNLRHRGYLQYPWELWLSSTFAAYSDYQACFAKDAYCSGEEGLDPERLRLIALHPGVGMGFSGFGWKDKQKPSADAALALSLELLGATYYQGNFKNYLGASLGAVVNDGNFADVRPGVFVHLTRWVHLGYLVSLFQRDTRFDATLFLSTDLGSALGASFLE
ncbi:MAG TPA: hypothetical protein VFN67_41130 [Polyangiales bacterium]|nr:hypothetical protein [Polyangiales bacterium]